VQQRSLQAYCVCLQPAGAALDLATPPTLAVRAAAAVVLCALCAARPTSSLLRRLRRPCSAADACCSRLPATREPIMANMASAMALRPPLQKGLPNSHTIFPAFCSAQHIGLPSLTDLPLPCLLSGADMQALSRLSTLPRTPAGARPPAVGAKVDVETPPKALPPPPPCHKSFAACRSKPSFP